MKKIFILFSALIMSIAVTCGLAACDFSGGGNSGGGSVQNPPDDNGGSGDNNGGGNSGGEHTHNYVITIDKPTDTATGKVTEKCTCGDTNEITLPVLTSGSYGKTKDTATCIKGGVIKYNITIDGANYRFEVATPATGVHSYVSGVCACGASDPNYVPPHVHSYTLNKYDKTKHWKECSCGDKIDAAYHSWNSGAVTKNPTCDDYGVKTFNCLHCAATKEESVPKSDHSWDNGVVTKAADCYNEGVKTYTCAVCSDTKTEVIAKTKHHFIFTSKDETYHTVSCENCQETRPDEKHVYNNGTCTSCGHKQAVITYQGFIFRVNTNQYSRASSPTTVAVVGFAGASAANAVIPSVVPVNGTSARVTEIASGAFEGDQTLTSIVIPETVTVIGDCAFMSSALKGNLTLSASLESIGVSAFAETNLEYVEVNARIIYEYAFEGCRKLIDVRLGAKVECVGGYAFKDTGLIKVRFESGIQVRFYMEAFGNFNGEAINFNFADTKADWDVIQKDPNWFAGSVYYLHTQVVTGSMQSWRVENGVETPY